MENQIKVFDYKGSKISFANGENVMINATEMGLFELKKGTHSGNNGVMYTTITPKVTGKGQVYFVNKFNAA